MANLKTELYFHFRDENNKLTIASKVDRENKELRIGVFDFNVKNQNFARKIGRNAAIGRAVKRPFRVISYTETDNPYNMFLTAAKFIVEKYYTKRDVEA